MWPRPRTPERAPRSSQMNPLAPSFVPRNRLRDSVTPKARPATNTRSEALPRATSIAATRIPPVDFLPCYGAYVPPAKLAAQRRLVESILLVSAPTVPSREGSVTPRARPRPTQLVPVPPAPHEVAVAPAVIYATSEPATPVLATRATPVSPEDEAAIAALLTLIGWVEEWIAGLKALRLRDVVDRVPEAEIRQGELTRWWVAHEALLSVMPIVYMHDWEEARRRFEWCVRS